MTPTTRAASTEPADLDSEFLSSLTQGETRKALLAALVELLEAERTCARVAQQVAREIVEPELAALVQDIHKDEVHCWGMLSRTIQSLQTTPSTATGAFWGMAVAIPDVADRLRFLNRSQAWVVRKLQALLPCVEDVAVRSELDKMLQAHHQNISRLEARLASCRSSTMLQSAWPTTPVDHIEQA